MCASHEMTVRKSILLTLSITAEVPCSSAIIRCVPHTLNTRSLTYFALSDSTPIPQVRTLVATLAEKLGSSSFSLDAQAIGNALYGADDLKYS